MYARTCTVVCFTADGNMVRIEVGNWKILCDHIIYLLLKLCYIEFRLALREAYNKAVLDVVVSASCKLVGRHAEFAQILGCMRHKSIGE